MRFGFRHGRGREHQHDRDGVGARPPTVPTPSASASRRESSLDRRRGLATDHPAVVGARRHPPGRLDRVRDERDVRERQHLLAWRDAVQRAAPIVSSWRAPRDLPRGASVVNDPRVLGRPECARTDSRAEHDSHAVAVGNLYRVHVPAATVHRPIGPCPDAVEGPQWR